jgi:hypothetical protein
MKRNLLAVAMGVLVTSAIAPQTAAQTDAQARAAILAVVDSALAAINRGDNAALANLMIAEAQSMPVRAGDTVRYSVRTRADILARPAGARITERGFDAEVKRSGPLSTVWLPYDLYIDGRWSHCGIDVLTLVHLNGKWMIANFAWTVEQPPACRRHPDGPPGGVP